MFKPSPAKVKSSILSIIAEEYFKKVKKFRLISFAYNSIGLIG
jgi:hypothetical protein